MSAERRRKDHFEVEPEFDVSTVFRDAIAVVLGGPAVNVVLELSPQVAHLPELRRFHRSQRTTMCLDGSARLTMRVANTPDVLSSVLAWGECG